MCLLLLFGRVVSVSPPLSTTLVDLSMSTVGGGWHSGLTKIGKEKGGLGLVKSPKAPRKRGIA